MVSVIKQQLMNETRVHQGVSDYVCPPFSRLLSILFGKLRVIQCSAYSVLPDCPNFNECCSCMYEYIHEARIAGVKKMTGHLALSR